MIYGNAVMLGGGDGGLTATDAILRVQAPAGSTVTITKDTTTKTDLGHENANDHTLYDYYFIIHQSQFDSVNPWTVTATLGTQITTSAVIIDLADEYDLVLSYLLPAGYQQVEYLESTGTQYINLNYVFSHGDFVYLLGQMTALQNDNTFFEVTSSSSVRSLLWGNSSGVVGFYNNSTGATRSLGPYATNVDLNMSVTSVLTINGSSTAGCQISGQSRPVFLFAGNDNGGVTRYGKVRIKYMKIMTGSTIKRELYPCYRTSDSVAGLYDIANDVFYTNNGSGSFVVGGNV